MRVLVTGSGGFIGSRLAGRLREVGYDVIAASRSGTNGPKSCRAPELGRGVEWGECLRGVEVVIHLAGWAGGRPALTGPEADMVNGEGTRVLAMHAVRANVKHFVFMSSCHAIRSESDEMLTASTQSRPTTVYGLSKARAEVALKQALEGSSCEWTILRPPAVYGIGKRAGIALLARWVRSGAVLPFASVHNRRSFIALDNLVEALVACVGNERSFGQAYFPSDGDDLSTADLVRLVARVHGKPVRLTRCPPLLLRAAAGLPGCGALRKLVTSLFVDPSPLARDLGWRAQVSMKQVMHRMLDEC